MEELIHGGAYIRNFTVFRKNKIKKPGVGGGGSYFPYILLNEIQTTTTLGDRFASCENIVSWYQTSSLPPLPPGKSPLAKNQPVNANWWGDISLVMLGS